MKCSLLEGLFQYVLGQRCPKDYPFAYKAGSYCCKTNEERSPADTLKLYPAYAYEIDSGTCDGIGFGWDSVCCKNEAYQKCSGNGCSNYLGNFPHVNLTNVKLLI